MNPWLAPLASTACTWAVTSHWRYPEPDVVDATGPLVAGWLLHVTDPSAHGATTCAAYNVRPLADDPENNRNVADCTAHPSGTLVGIAKCTNARRFDADFDITLSVESLPLLSAGLP